MENAVSTILLQQDVIFVGGSFAFVFVYMWFMTGSLFLTCHGMFMILFAFVPGILFYNFLEFYKCWRFLLFLGLGLMVCF